MASPLESFDTGGGVADLEPGGRVVGPPAHSWSLTGGYGVVVALDDGADAGGGGRRVRGAVRGVRLRGHGRRDDLRGNPAVAAHYSRAGGGDLEAVVVEDPDSGRSFLRLARAND